MSWYWHEIGNEESARYATTPAVWVSYLIAGLTGLIAIVCLIFRKPILGANSWALVDYGLFAIIGWRIACLSHTWAVVGLSAYLVEALVSFATRSFSAGAVAPCIMALVFLAAYVNALRGTVAYHKYLKLRPAHPSQSI
jgi:hypothetical protein